MQRGFQFLTRTEMVRLENVLDPAVEALGHAVGLRMLRRGQTVFDAGGSAEQVELLYACGGARPAAQRGLKVTAGPSRPSRAQ